METFINQISKVEYLDLFVSCLHEEDVTVTKYRETINDAAAAAAGGGITKKKKSNVKVKLFNQHSGRNSITRRKKFSPISMIPKLIEFVKPY